MNGDPQQQGQQGTVPMRDPNDPQQRVFMVPRAKMDGYVKRGAQVVQDYEFQTKYMVPSQKAAAAQKPSAGLGPTGQPVNQPPVAAAGTPPPSIPQTQPGLTLGQSAAGAGPGIQARDMPGIANLGIGMAKRLGQQGVNMMEMLTPGAMAAQYGAQSALGQSGGGGLQGLQQRLTPTPGTAQTAGAGLVDVGEFMVPAGAEEGIASKTAELLDKYAPTVVNAVERKMAQTGIAATLTRQGVGLGEQILKAAYQAITGAAVGKVQGRDPLTAGETAGVSSLVIGNLGRMSPSLVRTLFNVKDVRGGNVGKELMDLPGATRKTLGRNSAKELVKVEAQLSAAFSKPVRSTTGQSTGLQFNIHNMMGDVEKQTFRSDIPEAEAKKVRGLLKDMERFSGSVAPGRVKILQSQVGKKTEEIDNLRTKLNTATNTDVIRGIGASIAKRQQDIADLKKLLANQPITVSSSKLNGFRKVLENRYMPYGVPESQQTAADRVVKNVYNRTVAALTKGRPETAQLLRDSYALQDISEAFSKAESKSFGLHTIMDPTQLPRTLPSWLGWMGGHKFGGPAMGLLGAVAAGGARAPMTYGARAMASPYTKGLATGVSNLLINEPEDWSKKGKATPYGPME